MSIALLYQDLFSLSQHKHVIEALKDFLNLQCWFESLADLVLAWTPIITGIQKHGVFILNRYTN